MDEASGAPAPSPAAPPRPARRARLSALAALFVYLNIAAINAQYAANFPGVPALPVIDLLVDPFFLFGMFNGYEREVSELVIQGYARDGWRALAAEEFLPGPPAEHGLWAQAARSLGQLLPRSAILKERQRFLARIRERHNFLHPERPITRVRVGFLRWPKSRLGREARRERGKEPFRVLYEE